MWPYCEADVRLVYEDIISRVIEESRLLFIEEGCSEDVLQLLKETWLRKLEEKNCIPKQPATDNKCVVTRVKPPKTQAGKKRKPQVVTTKITRQKCIFKNKSKAYRLFDDKTFSMPRGIAPSSKLHVGCLKSMPDLNADNPETVPDLNADDPESMPDINAHDSQNMPNLPFKNDVSNTIPDVIADDNQTAMSQTQVDRDQTNLTSELKCNNKNISLDKKTATKKKLSEKGKNVAARDAKNTRAGMEKHSLPKPALNDKKVMVKTKQGKKLHLLEVKDHNLANHSTATEEEDTSDHDKLTHETIQQSLQGQVAKKSVSLTLNKNKLLKKRSFRSKLHVTEAEDVLEFLTQLEEQEERGISDMQVSPAENEQQTLEYKDKDTPLIAIKSSKTTLNDNKLTNKKKAYVKNKRHATEVEGKNADLSIHLKDQKEKNLPGRGGLRSKIVKQTLQGTNSSLITKKISKPALNKIKVTKKKKAVGRNESQLSQLEHQNILDLVYLSEEPNKKHLYDKDTYKTTECMQKVTDTSVTAKKLPKTTRNIKKRILKSTTIQSSTLQAVSEHNKNQKDTSTLKTRQNQKVQNATNLTQSELCKENNAPVNNIPPTETIQYFMSDCIVNDEVPTGINAQQVSVLVGSENNSAAGKQTDASAEDRFFPEVDLKFDHDTFKALSSCLRIPEDEKNLTNLSSAAEPSLNFVQSTETNSCNESSLPSSIRTFQEDPDRTKENYTKQLSDTPVLAPAIHLIEEHLEKLNAMLPSQLKLKNEQIQHEVTLQDDRLVLTTTFNSSLVEQNAISKEVFSKSADTVHASIQRLNNSPKNDQFPPRMLDVPQVECALLPDVLFSQQNQILAAETSSIASESSEKPAKSGLNDTTINQDNLYEGNTSQVLLNNNQPPDIKQVCEGSNPLLTVDLLNDDPSVNDFTSFESTLTRNKLILDKNVSKSPKASRKYDYYMTHLKHNRKVSINKNPHFHKSVRGGIRKPKLGLRKRKVENGSFMVQARSSKPIDQSTSIYLLQERHTDINKQVKIILPTRPGISIKDRTCSIQVPQWLLQGAQLPSIITPLINSVSGLGISSAKYILQHHVNKATRNSNYQQRSIVQCDGPSYSPNFRLMSKVKSTAVKVTKKRLGETAVNSDDDETDEENPVHAFESRNIIICRYKLVKRYRSNIWTIELSNGIMHLNGKDYVFQNAIGKVKW